MTKYIVTLVLAVSASATFANITSDILSSRSEQDKTQILSNLLNAAGEPCIGIKSFYQGVDTYDAAYWNLACSDGQSYVIQISNDKEGTKTIFHCISMKSLGAECFKKFGQ